jgi:ProP effector
MMEQVPTSILSAERCQLEGPPMTWNAEYFIHHLPACHTETIFRLTIGGQASPMGGWMTITKQDIDAALACLTEAFPQTFVLERNRPHRPLKVGIAADIPARCPAVERRVLSAALRVYARRVMYLRGLVAGAARVDLDGKEAGEVTARDAEDAAAKLAKTLASREAKRAAAVETKGAAQVAKPAAATVAAAAPPAVKVLTLKKKARSAPTGVSSKVRVNSRPPSRPGNEKPGTTGRANRNKTS